MTAYEDWQSRSEQMFAADIEKVVEQLPTLLTFSSPLNDLITKYLLQMDPLSRGSGRVIASHAWLIDQHIHIHERQESTSRGNGNLNTSNRTNSSHFSASVNTASNLHNIRLNSSHNNSSISSCSSIKSPKNNNNNNHNGSDENPHFSFDQQMLPSQQRYTQS